MSDFIEVRTALSSQEDANKIAQHLVAERLVASAQVSGPIASTYWWKGDHHVWGHHPAPNWSFREER